MTPRFDRYIAVDWSGARGPNYAGIAIAECREGDAAPTLVMPPSSNWSRSDFADWLAAQEDRVLVGIDCAFALPARAAETRLCSGYDAASLWKAIEQVCAHHADYYGGAFADHHAPLFWRSGKRPVDFAEHHRATELACRDKGLGAPESPLKLVGAKQVGKGGLAGMRTLGALKRRLGDDFSVWPFDCIESARIVCVELYPRLFLRMAGHGNGKVRNLDDLNRCLRALGSASYSDAPALNSSFPRRREPSSPPAPAAGWVPAFAGMTNKETADSPAPLTDHDTDALIAAAGLRHIAGDPKVWSPPGLDALARRAEGWIFGVT
jgi:hypothetical protein